MFNYGIEIEKGVKPPKISPKKPSKYNWDYLEVGDSFVLEKSKQCSVLGSFNYWQKKSSVRSKYRLTSVSIPETDEVRFCFLEIEK